MYNPFGYGAPQQPIVFMPPPQSSGGGMPDINQITSWITGLEQLKKVLKEEKQEKKDDGKRKDPAVITMMLLMLLLSPITGSAMSTFFAWGRGMVH